MKKILDDDTIAARATPTGEGAIAVIRVSGGLSITAIDRIFRGTIKLSEATGYSVHFGEIVGEGGAVIDQVLATVFRSPHSYTGEDSVEISCHGGMYVSQRVLDAVFSTGVRPAAPGEFTKRAFLNGKMDLSQAEAVADLISARSEASYRTSLAQLEGRFSTEVGELRKQLIDLCSLVEIELDFSEEGLNLISREEIVRRIDSAKAKIQAMVDSYKTGKVCREGASVVIVGRPNAGKSSLFNALLKESRAIVTDRPGTTRDSLEESVTINGVLFRLFDTAGLTETTEPVEAEGIERAKRLAQNADIILLVRDESEGESDKDESLEGIQSATRVIVVNNKVDLRKGTLRGSSSLQTAPNGSPIPVSAKFGFGLDHLRAELSRVAVDPRYESDGVICTNARHATSLGSAASTLEKARESLESGISREFVATDILQAADYLAEIVGEVSSDDLLNNIFSQFCVGK